ncbi:hypothetical protein [Lewinella sp. W8]|uniref:hypothetical protein n=1 Tax=Lewinella sp. W8 TaxID=2528208 RepID=UPI00106772E7|nr:hypothetical protein [Lewinella sp. W8]MTB51322.1 hypothetical protein [Lewinella sp. W8]
MKLLSSSNYRQKILCLLCFCAVALTTIRAQSEADHIRVLGEHFQGATEVHVENGRIDILTKTHAIEVEWASKWKNSIGQALWYAQQKNVKAGIILLLKERKDLEHFYKLTSTLSYAGLSDLVTVMVYPDQFPGLTVGPPPIAPNDDHTLTHWLNLSSNKRHNASCEQNFGRTKNGRYCRADEGVACGRCGG